MGPSVVDGTFGGGLDSAVDCAVEPVESTVDETVDGLAIDCVVESADPTDEEAVDGLAADGVVLTVAELAEASVELSPSGCAVEPVNSTVDDVSIVLDSAVAEDSAIEETIVASDVTSVDDGLVEYPEGSVKLSVLACVAGFVDEAEDDPGIEDVVVDFVVELLGVSGVKRVVESMDLGVDKSVDVPTGDEVEEGPAADSIVDSMGKVEVVVSSVTDCVVESLIISGTDAVVEAVLSTDSVGSVSMSVEETRSGPQYFNISLVMFSQSSPSQT